MAGEGNSSPRVGSTSEFFSWRLANGFMKITRISRFALVVFITFQALTASAEMSRAASDYLKHAIDLMQQHALHRKEIDWPQLRRAATAYAKDAQTPAETYPAITYACLHLKDHSSHLEAPNGTPIAILNRIGSIRMLAVKEAHGRKLISDEPSPFADRSSIVLAMLQSRGQRYAYLVIPYSAYPHRLDSDPRRHNEWAEDLFHLVTVAKQRGAQGWIVDLRGNTGGYLSPMLAGLQSLLGDGNVLTLRGPGAKNRLSIKNGAVLNRAGFGRESVEANVEEKQILDETKAPVVILLDRGTQSAGESLAIAFEGRKRTLFLGERTAGLTDSGTYWDLPDGAVLSIMSQRVYDRHGHDYLEGIEPETLVQDPKTVTKISDDPAVLSADDWLSHMPQR
jgi:carboxyl-terminal processing protease